MLGSSRGHTFQLCHSFLTLPPFFAVAAWSNFLRRQLFAQFSPAGFVVGSHEAYFLSAVADSLPCFVNTRICCLGSTPIVSVHFRFKLGCSTSFFA